MRKPWTSPSAGAWRRIGSFTGKRPSRYHLRCARRPDTPTDFWSLCSAEQLISERPLCRSWSARPVRCHSSRAVSGRTPPSSHDTPLARQELLRPSTFDGRGGPANRPASSGRRPAPSQHGTATEPGIAEDSGRGDTARGISPFPYHLQTHDINARSTGTRARPVAATSLLLPLPPLSP